MATSGSVAMAYRIRVYAGMEWNDGGAKSESYDKGQQ